MSKIEIFSDIYLLELQFLTEALFDVSVCLKFVYF